MCPVSRLRYWCSSEYLRISPLHSEFYLPLPNSSAAVLKAIPELSPGRSPLTYKAAYVRFTPSHSEPEGRFPRVTHPCATRPEGLVRLACVRHAASVRSEPESNSQVDVRSSPRWNKREQDRHLREPFLHKNHNLVCLRF